MKKKVLLLIFIIFLLCGCGKEYYCDEGTLSEGVCVIVYEIDGNITCEDGFEYNEDSELCENTISIAASGSYVCVDGYTLISGQCVSDTTYSMNDDGTCPSGTKKFYGNCKKIKYRDYEYTCPSGTLNEETNKCEFLDTRDPDVTCEDGYTISGTKCVKTIYEDAKER